MNAIELAIDKLSQVRESITAIGDDVVGYSEDLKRGELRLGIGTDGLMPTYADEYYLKYKRSLSSYRAARGAYDLFVSGNLHKGIQAVNINNVVSVGNSSKSPDYAAKFSLYTEGISDKGENQIVERAGLILINKISKILHV